MPRDAFHDRRTTALSVSAIEALRAAFTSAGDIPGAAPGDHTLWRSARSGSTRTARSAGTAVAAVQISNVPAQATTSVTESVAVTPNSCTASRWLIAR